MEKMLAIGLERIVVAETDLSLVDGQNGLLVYRGHWARDLAISHTFEEVAYLLWFGALPTEEQLSGFHTALAQQRALPKEVKQVIDAIPHDRDMMTVLRTAVSALGSAEQSWPPTLEQSIAITAKMPTIIAYREARKAGREPLEPRMELSHTANYLYMLKGTEASYAHVRALDAYLVLTQEHGMNASTFAGRVVTSTQSDIYSALTAAIGALKGPLHGAAPSEVTEMINAIGSKDKAEEWIRIRLESGQRLMGFGHRVYKTIDPRATALRVVAAELAADDPWFDLATHVEQVGTKLLAEHKPKRKLHTNVEFFAAAVMRAVGLDESLFTPTFAVSRTVGWCAHILDQAGRNRIIRPESEYTGNMPKS
ncbi:citrate synthase/methylcitrate synthase [Brevibacillus laterosporus]|uniref:citrate synthase/methylcitrate synthase n=1 Tax=Brevibacillus laterosporus TaxID=1465 RepID=UPI000E6C1B0F|nr:citrate synthase/methylcitrate synthase [Brevibacillus laterosporus]AYB40150.1 citrate synthase/methylcitrate synthase [Brevibacillus laterosporus]MBM7110687.1 Citrate synthase 1 [Brevibacillus laterosporus]